MPELLLPPSTSAAANSESEEAFDFTNDASYFEEEFTEVVHVQPKLKIERKAEEAGRTVAMIVVAPFVYLYMIPVMIIFGCVTAGVLTGKGFIKSFFTSAFEFVNSLTMGFNYPRWIVRAHNRFDDAYDRIISRVRNRLGR